MGQFFANIQIKKNITFEDGNVKEYLIEVMKKQGFEVVDDESGADGTLNIYAPKESAWISICSDLIDFENVKYSKKYIMSLARRFSTDVMLVGCFDSDYLFVNLFNENEKIDGWINIGRYEGMPLLRRTALAAWKKRIKEIDRLKEIAHTEYVFVEEAMEHLGELMNLPYQQGCVSERCISDLKDSGDVVTLFLAMKDTAIKKELPRLDMPQFSVMPCEKGKDSCVFVVNKGGKGRGIGIAFHLNSKEDIDVMFKDVFLEYDLGKHPRTCIPIELEKRKMKDGRWMYWWEDRDFQIPPKVNQNLPLAKMMKLEFNNEFGVRFTPYGNTRKFLDIRVTFIPLDNFADGQCTWYAWRLHNSKREYIEKHNESWVNFGSNREGQILNPDDYDL